jgi:anti-sigma factor (TIGR02949 family)
MADCNETIRELDAFLDGELRDEVRAHIHVHLESCMDCLQAFDFQAELRQAIRRKCGNDEMPPGLLDRIERCFDDGFLPDT